jgi:hypothetical protein
MWCPKLQEVKGVAILGFPMFLILFQMAFIAVVLWLVWQFLETFRHIARSLERMSIALSDRRPPYEPPGQSDPGLRQ